MLFFLRYWRIFTILGGLTVLIGGVTYVSHLRDTNRALKQEIKNARLNIDALEKINHHNIELNKRSNQIKGEIKNAKDESDCSPALCAAHDWVWREYGGDQ